MAVVRWWQQVGDGLWAWLHQPCSRHRAAHSLDGAGYVARVGWVRGRLSVQREVSWPLCVRVLVMIATTIPSCAGVAATVGGLAVLGVIIGVAFGLRNRAITYVCPDIPSADVVFFVVSGGPGGGGPGGVAPAPGAA